MIGGAVSRLGWGLRVILVAVIVLGAAGAFVVFAIDRTDAASFAVNDFGDAVDHSPGDGKCETIPSSATCTLRAAIQEANAVSGRTVINLSAGIYHLTLSGPAEDQAASGDLDIQKDLTIAGAGTTATVIEASGFIEGDRVFHLIGPVNVELSGLTITGGKAPDDEDGGAILADSGSLRLIGVTLSGNSAGRNGGGLSGSGDLLIESNSAITENIAHAGHGGGIWTAGSLRLKNSLISQNQSINGVGGGIASAPASSLILERTNIHQNSAAQAGGGIHNDGGTLNVGFRSVIMGNVAGNGNGGGISTSGVATLSYAEIRGNTSLTGHGAGIANTGNLGIVGGLILDNNAESGEGGGIHNAGTLSLGSVGIQGNQAAQGGGIANSSLLAVTAADISRNSASRSGGAIFSRAAFSLMATTIVGNSAGQFGGGIHVVAPTGEPTPSESERKRQYSLRIGSTTINSNSAGLDAGGILLEEQALIIADSLITENRAREGTAGGILNRGTLEIGNTTISGNTAVVEAGAILTSGGLSLWDVTISNNAANAGPGGGLVNDGQMVVRYSAISSNSATGPGGGVVNRGTASASNATISNNLSTVAGGGIFNAADAILELTQVTLAYNNARSGGNLANDAGTVDVQSSIIAHSIGSANCSAPVTSRGSNLEDSDSCGLSAPDDGTNQAPLLGPLQINGGASPSHSLAENSSAIDAAQAGCLADDQRHVPRPQGLACDIGAFEREQAQPQAATPTAAATPTVPTASPTASGTPAATPTVSATATTQPTPSPVGSTTPTPRPMPTATAYPSPTLVPTPSPYPTPTAYPTPTPFPTPTRVPAVLTSSGTSPTPTPTAPPIDSIKLPPTGGGVDPTADGDPWIRLINVGIWGLELVAFAGLLISRRRAGPIHRGGGR